MLGRNIAWSIVALGVASAMWACSSDGDDTAASGGAGGAAAGAGGHAGGAGGAGGHTAGSGGTTAQAGTAGKGGTGAGGGTAGKGGGNAAAGTGDAVGGEGGATGGTGSIDLGGAGGEVAQGGEGGASAPTLADNCATVCSDQTGLSCTYGSTCVAGCTGLTNPDPDFGTAFPAEYEAMIACQAKQLTAAQYYCSVPSMGPAQPAPKASTACETLICKWTCDDGTNVDPNVFARCGC
jgi:hypothetical protein